MKKFFISFVFIIAGFFVVDRLGGVALWWVNQHSHDRAAPKIKYIAEGVSEDVVLMGASRCNFHYVSSIIRDSIGMSVYNGGIDAIDNIYAHYVLLNHLLAHHKPKVICLEVMLNDGANQSPEFPDPFFTLPYFAPYIGNNKEADSVYRLAGKYWQYQLSHLYRYNAKLSSNLLGLIVNTQKNEKEGYCPLSAPTTFPKLGKARKALYVDSLKLDYVQRYINLCHQKDVYLVFVVSPSLSTAPPNYYDALKNIAAQNGVPFIDYHTTGLFHNHPEYFRDQRHLWDKGAKLYSKQFAGELKQLLSQRL